MRKFMGVALATVAFGTMVFGPTAFAQGQGREASPAGVASTEIGGKYSGGAEPVYAGGKWIEITSGRPIKRGRDLYGSGADYGKVLNSGAPVWRAGANVTTRLKTELPIVLSGKTIPAGEYSLFIDLKPNDWTLVVSSWGAQKTYNPAAKDALWGSFGYTPAKDVARAKMTLGALPFAVDQLTWSFVDMSDAGGKIAIMWDKVVATTPFTTK